MKSAWRKTAVYAAIIAAFVVIAYGFVPQVLSGKIVNQSDISGYVGMAHEANSWNDEHPDDRTAWTNSMFGGMPTTMLTENKATDLTQPLYDILLTGRRPASYLLISLIGAFLLMLALGCGPITAAAGAIAITFCSYNMQIIQVGHNSKMLALAFAPWVLAAVVFTYKSALEGYRTGILKENPDTVKGLKDVSVKSWLPLTLLGSVLFALALGLQIKANHVQISYYLAIIIFSYVLVLIVWLFARKENRHLIGRFFAASALLLVLGGLGIATSANKLIPTWEYTQHTMRGGSELRSEGTSDKSKGLDLKYATSWSYGWNELPNLMIPNYNGGASAGAINPDKSETIKLLRQAGQTNLKETAKALPLYWGPQPFTAGPMYMGTISVFLFILGLFICRSKEKWWLLIPTIIAICLGVGYHFMPFTKFWFYHVPFYNKFRTVSMSLTVLQITLPALGFWVLDRLLKGGYTKEEWQKSGLGALIITGGFCLLLALFPGIAGDFSGGSDSQMPEQLVDTLIADRRHLLVSDAWMALIQILLTAAVITWFYMSKNSRKQTIAAGVICIMVLINMFSIGKRYLNSDHFVTPRQFNSQFTARNVDKAILADSELDYRVLDLTVDPFNSAHPSYLHKNIGGYSPVKLQRYQDLIERHLTSEINSLIGAVKDFGTIEEIENNIPETPVLGMLNNKYVILTPDVAVENRNALGTAWFVDNAVPASDANEEIDLLGSTDLAHTAVIGKDFGPAADNINALKSAGNQTHSEPESSAVSGSNPDNNHESSAATDNHAQNASTDGAQQDSGTSVKGICGNDPDYIELAEYAPNKLTYKYFCESPRAVVFSEIYYPDGWTATVDGNENVDIFRADWTLRGCILPAGEHSLTMTFHPSSWSTGATVTTISSVILTVVLLLALALVLLPLIRRKGCENAA